MKSIFRLIAISTAAVLAAACSEKEELPVNPPKIKIEILESDDPTKINVLFTPDESAARFEYAIGKDGDLGAFTDGSLESIVEVDGNEAAEVEFSGLEATTIYSIFARAYSSENHSGGINVVKTSTADARLDVQLQYALDSTAGFRIAFPPEIYQCRYYLGTAEDQERFESGEIDGSYLVEVNNYGCVNYFDLQPSTDYVFYAVGEDRKGMETNRFAIPFRTYATGECPNVEISSEINIYEGRYTVTPNELCGHVILAVTETAATDAEYILSSGFFNDIPLMLGQWETNNFNCMSSDGEPIEMPVTTYTLENSNPIEVYIVIYDKEGKLAGAKHYSWATPAFDESLDLPNAVNVTVDNITTAGGYYHFDADDTVFGYFYETVGADWYDDILENGVDEDGNRWNEYYLGTLFYQTYLLNQTLGYLHMGNGEYDWMETSSGATGQVTSPDTRYYATAFPFNENGPREGGWGPVTLTEYRTLPE